MRTIAKLFGRSPFQPLQAHREKVRDAVLKAHELMEAFYAADHARVAQLAEEVSTLEHAADAMRQDLTSQLSKGLFMAVDRSRLSEILETQDNLADMAENLGKLLTLMPLVLPASFQGPFQRFVEVNFKAFEQVYAMVQQLDELLESGFGGSEAERVRQMAMDVAHSEHEADVMQHALLQKLFAEDERLSKSEFFLWGRVFAQVARLSDTAERLALGIRRTLELK
ncbi:MAG: TIGR00153 family protein [Phycisphaeraceae bacterium]|nr:TIGR00153 family protein [Phycisphaeraceae bacterium]